MTLTQEARAVFDELGLDREDALLIAQSVGKAMIEDSRSSDAPLTGMVHDGWGLHDDDIPACRFAAPNGDHEIVFSGQFRTKGDTPFVERRRKMSPNALQTLVEGGAPGRGYRIVGGGPRRISTL